MLKKDTSILKSGFIKNIGYLSVFRAITLVTPLITLPYLLSILGSENYGLIVFAQAINAYFQIFVNFGFDISGLQRVSENRKNKAEISKIVSCVYVLKGGFVILSYLAISLIGLLFYNKLEFILLLMLSSHIFLMDWLFPQWYYAGMEKMKYITIINAIPKLLFIGLIFLIIKKPTDFLLVPLIQIIGVISSGLITVIMLVKIEKINFNWPSKNDLRKEFQESLPFFFSRAASVFNLRTNAVIIGSFLGMTEVAIYDIALKVTEAGKIPFNILNQAFFPKMIASRDVNLLKKIIKYSFIAGILIYFLILFSDDFIVSFLNTEKGLSQILQILCLCIPIASVNYHIGNCALVALGKKRAFNQSVFFGTLVYVLMVSFVILLKITSLRTLSLTIVVVEMSILIYRVIFSYNLLYGRSYSKNF